MENVATRLPHLSHRRRNPFGRILSWLVTADQAYRNHSAMKRLDDHLLSDIGLSHHDISKARWDAPVGFTRK